MALQHRAKQTHHRLQHLVAQRALAPLMQPHSLAMARIIGKDVAHALVEVAAIDYCIALKIVLKAAKIEIGRPRGGNLVVD